MVADSVIYAANALQMATTAISFSAYLPQWIKLFKTKSSENIALGSWCLWILSTSFNIFYAVVQYLINGSGWPLIISATFNLSCILFTVFLIIKYKKKKEAWAKRPPADLNLCFFISSRAFSCIRFLLGLYRQSPLNC